SNRVLATLFPLAGNRLFPGQALQVEIYAPPTTAHRAAPVLRQACEAFDAAACRAGIGTACVAVDGGIHRRRRRTELDGSGQLVKRSATATGGRRPHEPSR